MEVLQSEAIVSSKNRKAYFVDSIILFVSIYSFFGYLLPKFFQYFLLAFVCIGLMLYSILKANKYKPRHIKLLFLTVTFELLLLLSAPYSSFPQTSIKTAINIITIVVIGFLLSIHINWFKKCSNYFLSFALVHAIFTFISYIFPDFFLRVVLRLLPPEISNASRLFMSYGLYAGITEQNARNAFYITVGIAMVVTAIINNNKSRNLFVLIPLFVITLLLTGKRGHLAANLLSIFFIIVVNAKIHRKSIFFKILISIVIIITMIALIIYIIPEAAKPFMRFIVDDGVDITSGRLSLYKNAIKLFIDKPIFGWGLGSFAWFQNKGTHNIYLQLLSENGIVGATIFILILSSNLLLTIRSIKKYCRASSIREYGRYLFFSLYIQMFFISYGMTGNPLYDGFIFIIYMVAVSIPYSIMIEQH